MQQTNFKLENVPDLLDCYPTEFDCYKVKLKLHGVDITVNLHDTAGQKNYDNLRPLSYRRIGVVLLVFSVISPDSFENMEAKWIPEIHHFTNDYKSRHDETILANLKKFKQMPLEQRDIDAFCKSHSLKYFETSAETGDGVEACLYAAVAAGMAFKYGKNNIPYRLKIHVLENETVERSRADPSKILYKGLSKVNKSLKRDLLEWIVRDSEKVNIKEIKEYLEDKEIHDFERFKSQLTKFQFSEDDQIPLTIWKMGKAAEEQYREVLQSCVENRYMERLPVVGLFGVRKTCLTRKLLRKQISDVTSTNGIEIMTQKYPAEVQKADLFADLKGWSESEASLDDFAEVALLDFAGQYEFYATHQTFLNKHAIYLLVIDVSKNIKGLIISEDVDENFLDLSEIPFEDIGEYINFWMDAIHCYCDEEQEIDNTKEALPSIIVVGTCCDKLQIDKETRKWEIQKQFDEILGDHPKRKHIKDFIMLSNTTSSETDFDVLRHRIVQLASKVETWDNNFRLVGLSMNKSWINTEKTKIKS
ncbi:RHOB [Mytilus coruscus]|uniref:RHOB n=1 Tax=Mytilus coruscus TaxID=42192 RepID=A0A6J8E8D4_MYTCO|nr:RHOB [Mytilus coruscus]